MPASLTTAIVLFWALLSSPRDRPTHEFDAPGLDAAAVERGLRARVGDTVDDWELHIDSEDGVHYSLTLREAGSRKDERRELTLSGETDEDRSRDLAATLALIIESRAESETSPAPTRIPRGFLALETHLGLGPPRAFDPALGVGLGGGAWLVRDHLQPRVRIAWSHSWSGELRVNQLGVNLGVAAGAPIARSRGRVWIGALVMPAFAWTHIRQVRTGTVWTGGGELGVVAQYRTAHLVLGVRTGIETTFPSVRALGSPNVIRFDHVRWLLALELGLGFLGRSTR